MTGRFLFSSLLVLCGACATGEAPTDSHTGRIVLERTQPRAERLARIPASAAWCAGDTTLSVVGSNDAWSAAIAVRRAWPADSAVEVPVDSARRAGSAQIAVRQLSDSVQAAVVAHGGTITFEQGGRTLTGRFEFTAGADSNATTMSGRFENIEVVSVCP